MSETRLGVVQSRQLKISQMLQAMMNTVSSAQRSDMQADDDDGEHLCAGCQIFLRHRERLVEAQDVSFSMDLDMMIDALDCLTLSQAHVPSVEDGDTFKCARFSSPFQIADRIDVLCSTGPDSECWKWSTNGRGSYSVIMADKSDMPLQGTRISLNLKQGVLE